MDTLLAISVEKKRVGWNRNDKIEGKREERRRGGDRTSRQRRVSSSTLSKPR